MNIPTTPPAKPSDGMEIMPPASAGYVAAAESRALSFLNPKLWQGMKVMAETFQQSGALPSSVKNAPQLMMVLQAGYEAGMQPLEAINSYYFVNGKLSLYGEMAIALVIRAGHKVEFTDADAQGATCTITRGDDGRTMSSTFTMKMAEARGLARKDPYRVAPENMMKFKAFHMTAKFIVPDAFHGVPLKEEIEDLPPTEVRVAEPGAAVAIPITATATPAGGEAKGLADALNAPQTGEEPPKGKKGRKKADKPTAGEAVAAGEAPAAPSDIENPELGTPAPQADGPRPDDPIMGALSVPHNPPPPAPPETDEEKFDRLVNEELGGRKLTGPEQMFCSMVRERLSKKA